MRVNKSLRRAFENRSNVTRIPLIVMQIQDENSTAKVDHFEVDSIDAESLHAQASKQKVVQVAAAQEKTKISTTYALINLLKGMVGPGCFALPISFKQAGLWAGFAIVFLLGIVSSFCMVKLVRCSQYLCKKLNRPSLDYGEMAYESFLNSFPVLHKFAFAAQIVVNGCLIALQLGICSVFYIFVVEHAEQIVTSKYLWPDSHISKDVYFFAALPCFLLLCTVRTLKVVTYICMFGNVLMTLSLTIILEELIRAPHFNTRELPAFTDINGATLAAGSILYALEGQALVLPLENKMKHPKEMKGFTGVLFTGVNLVTLIYAGVGFFGYITYGNAVQASITLNLSDKPLDFSVKIMLLLVVFSAFLIQSFPLVEMIWPPIKTRLREKEMARWKMIGLEYCFRYSIVLIAFGLAFAIPNLDDIIPLVGVSAGMMLALVLPSMLETVCLLPVWLEGPRWKLVMHLFMNTCYFILGIFFVVTGLQANIKQLINGST